MPTIRETTSIRLDEDGRPQATIRMVCYETRDGSLKPVYWAADANGNILPLAVAEFLDGRGPAGSGLRRCPMLVGPDDSLREPVGYPLFDRNPDEEAAA